MGAHAPRKTKRRPLLLRGRPSGHDARAVRAARAPDLTRLVYTVPRLNEQPAEDRAHLASRPAVAPGSEVRLDQTKVRPGGKNGTGLVLHPRGHNRLDEGLGNGFRHIGVDRPVESHDPAESRQRIGLARSDVRIGRRRSGGDAARIRMLDHDGRRLRKLQRDAGRGVEVQQVGVGELLALEHSGRTKARRAVCIPGRRQVRILAIPQIPHLWQQDPEMGRCDGVLDPGAPRKRAALDRDGLEDIGDRRVVGRRVAERLPGERESFAEIGASRSIEHGQHRAIVGRVHDDEDVPEAFRRGPRHRGSANVDLLEHGGNRRGRIARDPGKRVQVDGDDVDQSEAMDRHRGQVIRTVAASQDPGVNGRMQGLHAAVEHLGKPRDLADPSHGQTGVAKRAGGPAR